MKDEISPIKGVFVFAATIIGIIIYIYGALTGYLSAGGQLFYSLSNGKIPVLAGAKGSGQPATIPLGLIIGGSVVLLGNLFAVLSTMTSYIGLVFR